MKPGRPIRLLSVLALAVLAGEALAARIVLSGGRTIEAVVLERTDEYVLFNDGRATTRLPMSRVVEIVEGGPADGLVVEARGPFAAGRDVDGLMLLGRAAAEGADPVALAGALVEHQDALARVAPELGPQAADALEGLLVVCEDATTADGSRREVLAAVVRLRLETGHLRPLHRLIDKLAENPKDLELERERLVARLGAAFDRLLERGKFSEALDALVEVRRLDETRAGEFRAELVLLWARRERDAGNYEEALRIYETELAEASPAIARDRIAVTLAEAEDALKKADRLDRAIELYDEFGMRHDPDHSRLRLAELWRELGWRLLRGGELPRARMAFERGNAVAPGSADDALRRCDYAEAKAALAADDAVGHYKLGEWCAEWGMLDEAREAFEIAERSDALAKPARAQIDRLRNLEFETELRRLLDLYEAKEYVAVLHEIETFKSRLLPEGYRRQAEELDALARDALRISVAERPQQAEVLMQQAERAYWTGDHEEAYRTIRLLARHYQGTPAAARAEQFFRAIRHRLDLDRLERDRVSRPPPALLDELDSIGAPAAPASPLDPDPDEAKDAALAEEIERLRSARTTLRGADPPPKS